jgi:hypothetical protein
MSHSELSAGIAGQPEHVLQTSTPVNKLDGGPEGSGKPIIRPQIPGTTSGGEKLTRGANLPSRPDRTVPPIQVPKETVQPESGAQQAGSVDLPPQKPAERREESGEATNETPATQPGADSVPASADDLDTGHTEDLNRGDLPAEAASGPASSDRDDASPQARSAANQSAAEPKASDSKPLVAEPDIRVTDMPMAEPTTDRHEETGSGVPPLDDRQRYQTFRPGRSEATEAQVMEVAQELSRDAALQKLLIENPFGEGQEIVTATRFPDMAYVDVIRSAIISEPEGKEDQRIKRIPAEDQKWKIRLKVESSANAISGLTTFVKDNLDANGDFWIQPIDKVYEGLYKVTFGTTDRQEVQDRIPQKVRRDMQLAIVNTITDYQHLQKYRDAYKKDDGTFDSKRFVEAVFQTQMEGEVEVQILPVGFHVLLENKDDFGNLRGSKDSGSGGFTVPTFPDGEKAPLDIREKNSHVPYDLRGRIIVTNSSAFFLEKDKKEHFDHELAHVIQLMFYQANEYYEKRKAGELIQPGNVQEHIDELSKEYIRHLRTELVALLYNEYLFRDFHFSKQIDLMQQLKYSEQYALWTSAEVSSAYKNDSNTQMDNAYMNFLQQAKDFSFVVWMLGKYAREQQNGAALPKGAVFNLTLEKAHALLQLTPPEHIKDLVYYLGMDLEEYNQLMEKHERYLVAKLDEKVTEVDSKAHYDGDPADPKFEEKFTAWSEIGEDVLTQIEYSYPQEAIPALLKILDGSNNAGLVKISLYALGNIVQMHHEEMNDADLERIQTTVRSFFEKDYGESGKTYARPAKQRGYELLDEIDIHRNGIDWDRKTARILSSEIYFNYRDGKDPSNEQIEALLEELNGRSHKEWNYFFYPRIIDTLKKSPDGYGILLNVIDKGYSAYLVRLALQATNEIFEEIPLEAMEKFYLELPTVLQEHPDYQVRLPDFYAQATSLWDKINKEHTFRENFDVQAFTGSQDLWDTYGYVISSMYTDEAEPIFRETLEDPSQTVTELLMDQAVIRADMISPDTFFVALIDKSTQKLAGFTYASPCNLSIDYEAAIKNGMTKEEYFRRRDRTASVGWTIIAPEYRSQGGFTHMTKILEKQLRDSGKYDEVIFAAREANDLAGGKIHSRIPQDNIVYEFPHREDYGPQRFFRINLK